MIRIAKAKYEQWLTEDGLIVLEGWAREGLTDELIASKIGIASSTLYEWKNRYPEISEALKTGKEPTDFRVENKLLDSALGFKVKIKKPIKLKTEKYKVNEGKIIEERVEYVEEEIYIPPSNIAQIFWLKNRKPNKWRDKPIDDSEIEDIDATRDEVYSDANTPV